MSKEYIFFAAGRIIPLKGLHILLNSLIRINYTGKINVAGNLDQMPEYKWEILNLAKQLDVQFIGLIKEKKTLYNYIEKAKLFVFPSYNETMSIMLLEVAQMKTALICCDIPENKAIFSNKEVLYFKNRDEKDLSKKIIHALNHPCNLMCRKQRAFEKLKKDFTWQNIAYKYDELYRNITCLN